jgi:hypothetical protein
MNVIICDNNSSNLSSAKSAIKGKVETVEMDVSKVEDFEKLKSKVEKEFNGIPSSPFPPPQPQTRREVNCMGLKLMEWIHRQDRFTVPQRRNRPPRLLG